MLVRLEEPQGKKQWKFWKIEDEEEKQKTKASKSEHRMEVICQAVRSSSWCLEELRRMQWFPP